MIVYWQSCTKLFFKCLKVARSRVYQTLDRDSNKTSIEVFKYLNRGPEKQRFSPLSRKSMFLYVFQGCKPYHSWHTTERSSYRQILHRILYPLRYHACVLAFIWLFFLKLTLRKPDNNFEATQRKIRRVKYTHPKIS